MSSPVTPPGPVTPARPGPTSPPPRPRRALPRRVEASFLLGYSEANPAKSIRELSREFKLSKSQVHRLLREANPAKVYPKGRRPKLGKTAEIMVIAGVKMRVNYTRLAQNLGISTRTLYRTIARLKRQGAF